MTKGFIAAWNRFWFKPSTGRPEAYFRFMYGIILLLDLYGCHTKLLLFFSNRGLHPATPIDFLYGPSIIQVLYWSWIFIVVLLIFGIRTRFFSILNFLLAVYFFGLRGYVAPHAADWTLHAMAFYLMLMNSDQYLSLKHFWRKGPSDKKPAPVWPIRLAQINLGGTYFTAGLSKLADPGWIAGTAFWDTLRNPFFSHTNLLWLAPYESILKGINYGVIVFETALPFLLMFKRLRPWALLGLVVFHLGIDFTIKVGWFSWLATAYVFAFIDDLGFKKNDGKQEENPKKNKHAIFLNAFLCFHLVAFCLAQLNFVSIGLRHLNLRWNYISKIPVMNVYARYVARIYYFDVWPSTFFLRPVRFLFYEAVDSNGNVKPMPPFDADRKFAPGIRFLKEAREGLLMFRIASHGLSEPQWQVYIEYLVKRYQRTYKGTCPKELSVFRIYSNPEDFEGALKELRVPKPLLLKAVVDCGTAPPAIDISFTEDGKKLLRDQKLS